MIQKTPQKTILIAPLDWGLGHAARCIPIIKELQSYHIRIIIAADDPVKTMLKQEFPQLLFIDLSGYKIQYSRNKKWFHLKILFQLPQIITGIIKEHNWLKKTVKKYTVDAVISDNRFGLYHSTIPSVYITHQLFIKTGNGLSEKIAQKIHGWFIKKYKQCWVPDFDGAVNIAGVLSHPNVLPANVKYIGCLSRFEKTATVKKEINLLIILSGPEPQRTIFENILFAQLKEYTGKVLFVRGLPTMCQDLVFTNESGLQKEIIIKNYLSASELNTALQSAELVLCRSGYTSVMDLLKLNQKAVLVPTPGQTEQEYLAAYLSQQQIFCTASQEGFLLQDVINKVNSFSYQIPVYDMELYKKIIQLFVETL